jgi:hypothetical protein
MNDQLICTWLGITDAAWPPDHYRLLGLPTGEPNIERIEEQVHRRLESVRRYQLTHPEIVTEAMNRLAQAFVCLTDPAAKRAYDVDLLGEAAAIPPSAPVAVQEPPPLAWLQPASEELVPIDDDSPMANVESAAEPEAEEVAIPPLPAEQVESTPKPVDSDAHTATTLAGPPLDETPPDIVIPDGLPANVNLPLAEKHDPAAAEASAAGARRGLGTKRSLYFRIARTRKLLAAWEKAGRYLAQPQRRITRPAEATELIRWLNRIQLMLRGFPPVLGQAGQPGYLVVALALQTAPVPMFQTLLPSQRESLAQHWEAGRKFLTAHCQFLRQEARARRKRSRFARAIRATVSFVAEYPEYVLFALAILAVTFAIARL